MSALAAKTGRALDEAAPGILPSVRPEFLDAFHEGVMARHGPIAKYLHDFVGVSDNDARVLRGRYLRG